MKKLLLIDTFNFLHRAYHALPQSLRDKQGEPVNAVYGVASMIINIFDAIKPTYAVAALDGIKPTFRVEEFTAYKAHRQEMDPNLVPQITKVIDLIQDFGIKTVVAEGYEADDIMGTLAKQYGIENTQVIIASNDRDLWQLVDENIIIMIPTTTGKVEWLGQQEVKAKLGFDATLVPDYKGLKGDTSDNIPGVYGIGEKTAQKLILEFGSLENIYKNLDKVKPDSVKKKLEENYEQALMSKKLATIITQTPITISLEECLYTEDKNKMGMALERYNFKSLMRRLGVAENVSAKSESIDSEQPSLF